MPRFQSEEPIERVIGSRRYNIVTMAHGNVSRRPKPKQDTRSFSAVTRNVNIQWLHSGYIVICLGETRPKVM